MCCCCYMLVALMALFRLRRGRWRRCQSGTLYTTSVVVLKTLPFWHALHNLRRCVDDAAILACSTQPPSLCRRRCQSGTLYTTSVVVSTTLPVWYALHNLRCCVDDAASLARSTQPPLLCRWRCQSGTLYTTSVVAIYSRQTLAIISG